jgi:hypothetical protein
LEYRFEEQQHIKVAVFDIDGQSHDLTKHDLIGETEFTLAELVTAGQTIVKTLKRPGTQFFCAYAHTRMMMFAGLEVNYICLGRFE